MRNTVPILATALLLPATAFLIYFAAPEEATLGESLRLLYIHVPLAVVSVLAFLVAGTYSILYLHDRSDLYSVKFHTAARLGFLFTVLTTLTGSVWAKLAWGLWWNWDPRETSIVFLLLVYIAYFALRTSFDGRSSEKFCAAYLIFAAAIMPFFVFAFPRVYPSLHPQTIINSEREIHLGFEMRIILLFCMAAFSALFSALFTIENRIALLEKKRGEHHG
jgi:heme exporter protein C